MSDNPCEKCGKPNVPGCDGRGFVRIDDATVQACINIYRRQLAAHLGPEIAGVPHATSTPLLQINPEGGEALLDLTKQNLMIEARWPDLLPHLKYVLAFKGPTFFFKIVTDERIKSVFVGAEQYSARSKSVRDELETNNTLTDLLGASCDLAIVRLGQLGYPNRAAAGALKEILLHRESISRPTWLVDDPDTPWEHSKGADISYYVSNHYTPLSLMSATPRPRMLVQDSAEAHAAHEVLREEAQRVLDGEWEAVPVEEPPSNVPDSTPDEVPAITTMDNLPLLGPADRKKNKYRGGR